MFTDQKPFVAQRLLATFTRLGKRFGCKLCGKNFSDGDKARWVYANGTPGIGCGNFFVCEACDGTNEDVLKKAKEGFEQYLKLRAQWDA